MVRTDLLPSARGSPREVRVWSGTRVTRPAVSSLRAGDRVGDYVVEERLGRGGMGVVYAVRHQPSGVAAALKVISADRRDDEADLRRFFHEIRAANAVRHANVANVFGDGELEDGTPYLLMERLVGRGLDEIIRERAPLPIDEALDLFEQACAGVQAAHSLGIVHRDLKPANLFVSERRGRPHLQVLDFGISKVPSLLGGESEASSLTKSGNVMGSPRYMAPEQLTDVHEVDRRADIWALGIILFEMLTRRSPFPSNAPGEYFAKIVSEPPTPLASLRPDAPEDLGHIIHTCLRRDPDERFNTLSHVSSALARLRRSSGLAASAGEAEPAAAPDPGQRAQGPGVSPVVAPASQDTLPPTVVVLAVVVVAAVAALISVVL